MQYDTRAAVHVSETSDKELAFAQTVQDAQSSAVVEQMPGPTPAHLRNMTEHAFGFADAMTKKLRPPFNPPVACAEGCDHCCYQQVTVTAPELFRIVTYLHEEIAASEKETITARVRQLDRATRGMNTKARTSIKKPCGFLDGGRCSIYPVRPMACVEFTSYNVQDCKRGKRIGFKANGIIHEKAQMLVYHAVHNGLMDGLSKALPNSDNAWLELTAGVVAALGTPNAEDLWLSGATVLSKAHMNMK